jgi:hypothetical protein
MWKRKWKNIGDSLKVTCPTLDPYWKFQEYVNTISNEKEHFQCCIFTRKMDSYYRFHKLIDVKSFSVKGDTIFFYMTAYFSAILGLFCAFQIKNR